MSDPPHSILVLVVAHPQGLERLKWVGYKTSKVLKVALSGILNLDLKVTWTYVILSRVVAKFSTTCVQSDLMSSILMNSNIYKELRITINNSWIKICISTFKGGLLGTSRMAELRRL